MGRSRDLADGTLVELNVDSNTLAVDSTNNRVGIGTSSPSTRLNIVSGTNAGLAINDGTVNTIVYNTNSSLASLGTTTAHPTTFWTNNTERMRIDSSGRVTKPYQPMFAAYRNGNQNYTANNSFKIELNAVDFDIGSNFNTSTNRFTAPVSGIYLFTASIQYQTVGLAHTNLYKNGGGVSDGWLDFGDAAASSQTRVMSLSAGDYIELYGYNSAGNTVSSQRTKMTGFLIG